jgi:hypothetical protein
MPGLSCVQTSGSTFGPERVPDAHVVKAASRMITVAEAVAHAGSGQRHARVPGFGHQAVLSVATVEKKYDTP